MDGAFTIVTLLALLGSLLAGILLAWLLYGRSSHLDKPLRLGLAVLRSLVITGIGFLLFFPLVRSIAYRLEKPVIVIGQDNSLSVSQVSPAGFDPKRYRQQLEALKEQLSKDYDVKVYHFSDRVGNGFEFAGKGKFTNGTRFMNQIVDGLVNRNVGAVILATDGIFNRGGSPLAEAERLKAPVYTIALGDTVPKKDLLIANVNYNNLVYLDNEFTIEVQIQAFAAKGTAARLTVTEGSKPVLESRVDITSEAFVQQIPLKLKAKKLGLQKYTLSLGSLPGEISIQNNTQQIFIEVIDARNKVLLAAAGPHPDLSALKQAISSNKNYELKVAIGQEADAANPDGYSLVILYQLPGIHQEGKGLVSALQRSNTPAWYIVGAQSNLSDFNQVQKQATYNGTTTTLQDVFAEPDPNFTLFSLHPAAAKVLASFDPLQAPLGKIVPLSTATVALTQRIGKIRTGQPLLFFSNDNGRKAGYLAGEGLWRWRLSEAEDPARAGVTDQLISATVQYLSVRDDKRKFRVYPAKATFEENENVILNAVLYNDSYQAVNTPDVSISLQNDAGKRYRFLFSKKENTYQLDAGALPAGSYRYEASVRLGNAAYSAKGEFHIQLLNTEFQQTIANHQLLHTLSSQTGGKLYMPVNLLKIADEIRANEQIRTISYEDRNYRELINFKWVFALILLLLSAEWFLRKQNGET